MILEDLYCEIHVDFGSLCLLHTTFHRKLLLTWSMECLISICRHRFVIDSYKS